MELKTRETESDVIFEGIDNNVFKKVVCFGLTSRGNDIYYKLLLYLIHQKHMFPTMKCVVSQDSWRASTEGLMEMLVAIDSEFVHILDSDVAPRRDATARLLMHDLDIVAQPIYFFEPTEQLLHINVHRDKRFTYVHSPEDPEKGLEKIVSTSFGSVLIRHRVLEMFKQHKEPFTIWTSMLDERYQEAAPDSVFFLKAQEMGFDVYVDWGSEFPIHHRPISLGTKSVETYFCHRILDRTFGPARKNELLKTEDGCAELGAELQRGGRPVRTGRAC